MDDAINITYLNDFIFCPASIYFHNLYGSMDKMIYQGTKQIDGTHSHEAIDNGNYSSKKSVLQAISVYSAEYNLVGKIDLFDVEEGLLTERKRHIKKIYDGYVFQIYAQYFALKEMGYNVNKLRFYSMIDNKTYPIELPEHNKEMFDKFMKVIEDLNAFSLETFVQVNADKCANCIYEAACDRGVKIIND